MAELTLYCGPMFSGKTEALLDALEAAEARGARALAFKPAFDRRHPQQIISHSGRACPARVFDAAIDLSPPYPDLVVVDEVQFLPAEAAEPLRAIADAGIDIVASGLDLDYRRDPFKVVEHLRVVSDRVVVLRARCTRCGRAATLTQRFSAGRPAPLDGPTLLLGDDEVYQPRCERCFDIEREPTV